MSIRKNSRPNVALSAIAPSQRPDRLVTWATGMRPAAHPHSRGVVFLSGARETYVIWDGETRPQVVFTGALVTL